MRIISSEIIESAAPPSLWTDIMELAIKATNDKDYFTSQKVKIESDDNTIALVTSVAPDLYVTRQVSAFPNNSTNINETYLLNDGASGQPLALLNGNKITAIQTAAVANVGIRHLADPLSDSLGIIGAGERGRHIAWLTSFERDIRHIYVYDSSPAAISSFIEFMAQKCPDVDVALCEDEQQVIVNSEIVVTATNSSEPVIPNLEDLLLGKCFICTGSNKPGLRELPEAIYRLIDYIWIDTERGLKECGDLIFPLENKLIEPQNIRTLATLLEQPEELGYTETRLFKTFGHGIFDLFAAKLVYEKAFEKNLGKEVDL